MSSPWQCFSARPPVAERQLHAVAHGDRRQAANSPTRPHPGPHGGSPSRCQPGYGRIPVTGNGSPGYPVPWLLSPGGAGACGAGFGSGAWPACPGGLSGLRRRDSVGPGAGSGFVTGPSFTASAGSASGFAGAGLSGAAGAGEPTSGADGAAGAALDSGCLCCGSFTRVAVSRDFGSLPSVTGFFPVAPLPLPWAGFGSFSCVLPGPRCSLPDC